MSLILSEFVSRLRNETHEDLLAGRPPRQGQYDVALWKEAKGKDAMSPQVGAASFEPDAVLLEFLYPDPRSTAIVLSVRLQAPERIVHMPVPNWVVESIWQGEVSGSFRFESEAQQMLQAYGEMLGEGENKRWFLPQPPKRRE